MPDKLVCVLDANVIVSAVLLPRSLTRKAFDKALRESVLFQRWVLALINKPLLIDRVD